MSTRPQQILLIDDDPDMHLAVRMILEPLGYQITGCLTGADGIDAARRLRPDLVLLDIMLSRPTEGLQLAGQMRADEHLQDIPIVHISAIGAAAGKDYFAEACPGTRGAEALLEKPFDASALREVVNRVLGLRAG